MDRKLFRSMSVALCLALGLTSIAPAAFAEGRRDRYSDCRDHDRNCGHKRHDRRDDRSRDRYDVPRLGGADNDRGVMPGQARIAEEQQRRRERERDRNRWYAQRDHRDESNREKWQRMKRQHDDRRYDDNDAEQLLRRLFD